MAETRKKSPPDSSPAESSSRSASGTADRANGAWVLLVTGLFLGCFAVYLVLFYRVEFSPGQYRYRPLGYVVIPDELISQWSGGPFGELAILDRVKPFVVAGTIWVGALLLGWLILQGLRIRRHLDRLEYFTFAMGLGLSGASLLTLAIGLMGGLRGPVCFALSALLLMAMVVWRAWRGRVWLPSRGEAGSQDGLGAAEKQETSDQGHVPDKAWYQPRWWWLVLPFAAVILAGAVLPPWEFDVLEYHLQVPKQWYQQGQVTFLPHNVYGNMPLGAEMLATLAMVLTPGELNWWWGALAGKVVMASFSILTTMLVFAAGRRYFSATAGIVASLVFISTAWIAYVSMNGLNEGVVAYYLFASFFAGRLWWDASKAADRPVWGLLILTGLLCGSAVSCKYTSVILIAIPLFGVALLANRISRLRVVIVFLLAVTAACGLWFGKNWVLAGNPTYPLLVDVFGGETRTPEKDTQWRKAHQVPRDAQGHRYSWPQAWQATLDLLGRSRWHSPLIAPLAVLVLLRRDKYGAVKYWVALLAFVLVAWWLLTHRLDRFWVPAVPLMALLAGVGATWSVSLVWRRVLWIVMALGLVANFMLIASTVGDNRYFVSLRAIAGRSAYDDDAAITSGQRLCVLA